MHRRIMPPLATETIYQCAALQGFDFNGERIKQALNTDTEDRLRLRLENETIIEVPSDPQHMMKLMYRLIDEFPAQALSHLAARQKSDVCES